MNPLKRQPNESPSKPGDADLVRAARKGNENAFVEIVARHQAMVSGVTLAILGDFAAGEDAAQDAFVKAWKQLSKIRDPDKLRPWLCRVARTTALNHLQKRQSNQEHRETFDRTLDGRPSPDEALICEEERQSVLRALKSLPEKYRLPLVLYYHEEHSVRAVAGALDLGENVVKKRLSRGREMMRKRMNGMIDSVLGENLPGTTFTGGVVLALGALNPSSTSAATLATTTTAMSASKLSLSTMAVIAALSIPIGYSARVATENRTPSTRTTEESRPFENPDAKEIVSFKGPESALVIEWRKLRGTYGQAPGDLANLYQAILEIENPLKQRAFKSILDAEWAELDPISGITFFREQGREEWELNLFLREGLKSAGEATVTALIASGKGWESIAREVLIEIAEHVPGRLAEVTSLIPLSDSYWLDPVDEAFEILMRNDPEAARRAAKEITGPNRLNALKEVAMDWFKNLPRDDPRHTPILDGYLSNIGFLNEAAAVEKLRVLPQADRERLHEAGLPEEKLKQLLQAVDGK